MIDSSQFPSPSYLRIKTEEISYLAEYIRENTQKGLVEGVDIDNLQSYEQIIQIKLRMREAIKRGLPFDPYLGLTNLSGQKKMTWHGLDFLYTYQRSGLKLLSADHLSTIYPSFSQPDAPTEYYNPKDTFALFTRSGQSATFLSLMALKALLGRIEVINVQDELYFETRYTANFLCPRPPPSPSVKVLFIDSSTEKAGMEEIFQYQLKQSGKKSIVLIDTTCFPLNDRGLKKKVRQVLKHGLPCLLIRSHMKLDCLGMEYDLLGSVVFIPSLEDGYLMKKFGQKFKKVLQELCQIQGGYAQLSQIYPFYHSPQFHFINDKRNKRMQANAKHFSDKLWQSSLMKDHPHFKIHFFKHNLFLWIEFPSRISKANLGNLGKILSFGGIPYRFAESFGFDFMTISIFPNKLRKMIMRLAFSDLDIKLTDLVAQILLSWMKNIEKKP